MRVVALAGAVVLVSLISGCRTASQRVFSLLSLDKQPIAVALVADEPTAAVKALNPFPAYRKLQERMGRSLGQPVAVDVCFRFQAEAGFRTGWYEAAVLTPAQYADMSNAETLRVIAIPVDANGRATELRELLIVPAASAIEGPADLRGKVVAFGPGEDSLTHHAALHLLEKAGVRKADLEQELLPVPGSLRHYADGAAIAAAVASGSAAAGFVDETSWAALPETAEGNAPSRANLRVVGRTVALPRRLVVVSPDMKAETSERMQEFLLAVGDEHPDVLEPLGVKGYQVPPPEVLAACRELRGEQSESQPAAPGQRRNGTSEAQSSVGATGKRRGSQATE